MTVLTEFGKIAEKRVYELRIVGVDGRKRVDSGYFDDIELLAQAAGRYDNRAPGIYTTLNEVDPALFARSANKMQQGASNLTGDADIVRRRWLLVDLDPKRPGGISSTDAQHRAAHNLAVTIAGELAQSGWPAPVYADSGNGAHLLWRVDWPNSPEVAAAISAWLAQLNDRYGSAEMSVDRTVYSAAQIWKLYGTWARKGSSTADRPHRQSKGP